MWGLNQLKRRYLNPPSGRWEDEFVVITLATSPPVCAAFGLAYLLRGRPIEALAASLLSLGLVGVLERWRVRRSVGEAVHAALALVSAEVAAVVLSEPRVDLALLSWFALVPTVAVFLAGWRAGLGWMAVSLVAVLGCEALGASAAMPARWFEATRLCVGLAALFVVVVAFDLTRGRALVAARAAADAKSVFLANISHEIRTPLNGVLGMTEVMLQEEQTSHQRDQLEVIERSGQQLITLINDLLDLSKAERSKLTLDEAPFELRPLLADLTRLHAAQAMQRGLTLSLVVDDAVPPVVRGDALRLRQVLGNLLGNAVKFVERGRVALQVTGGPGAVRFAVVDTGPGIAPRHLSGLFEPFHQLEGLRTRRHGGTGLGLALSRQLVELMHGKLLVTSVLGEGSTFHFTVPLVAAERPSQPVALRALPRPANDSPPLGRVLVVDDNAINLRVARALVEKEGYEVVTATNGVEALERAAAQCFALVLMDCHMPVMDGFEATARIHQLPGAAGRVPIVALTASALADELEACRRAGMVDCLTKPVDVRALREVLARTTG